MKHLAQYISLLLLVLLCHTGCEDPATDGALDKDAPTVLFAAGGALPQNCDTVYAGQSFTLRVLLTDNVELAEYSVQIHNNFNQHSHTTEQDACQLADIKDAVDPFKLVASGTIPNGLTYYWLEEQIAIPTGKDQGDYHIQVGVTDKTGWYSFAIINVKLLAGSSVAPN